MFEIYKYEIEQMSPASDHYTDLEWLFLYLALYFLEEKKDYDKARTYFNLCNYINVERLLDDLINSTYRYYDKKNNLEEDRLKNNLITKFTDVPFLQTYEKLIFNDKLSNESIYKLFAKDVEQYYELDKEISELIINYLIAYIKNESIDDAYTKVLNLIKDKYVIDPKDFEDSFTNEHVYRSKYDKHNKSSLNDTVKSTKERKFNENEIQKYLNFVHEHLIDLNDADINGCCHSCGKFLDEVDLSEGPERIVTCLNCLDWFIEYYELHEEIIIE
ncbi:hypothetical protein LHJ68_08585 [Staphylococcus xylosus]|uniref:hypothetical protein n=1 Tax=Staphylococcus xylosus TaxID=1288 RepID=UPI001642F01C|nr:hypothetical protein [Staphylococcus xylosus]MCE7786049.1 hypothetical protein [Staphylococcus xylosus]